MSTLLVATAFLAVLLGWWSDRQRLKVQMWQATQQLIEVQHDSMKVHERIVQMRRGESDRAVELEHVTRTWYRQVGELNAENEVLKKRLQRLEGGAD